MNSSNRVRNAISRVTTDNSIQVLNRINRVGHSSHAGQIKRISVLKYKHLGRVIKSVKRGHEVRSGRIRLLGRAAHVEHTHRAQSTNNVAGTRTYNLSLNSSYLSIAHGLKQIIHPLSHAKIYRRSHLTISRCINKAKASTTIDGLVRNILNCGANSSNRARNAISRVTTDDGVQCLNRDHCTGIFRQEQGR